MQALTPIKNERSQTGTFLPGNNANPTGRPAAIKVVRDLCRTHTEAAVAGLLYWAGQRGKKCAAASVAACRELLERGWGKSIQPIAGADGESDLTIVHVIEQRIIQAAIGTNNASRNEEPQPIECSAEKS